MSSSDFADFVKRQSERSNEPEIDWEKTKDEWLQRLSELYKSVEGYLKDFTESGQIKIQSVPIYLSEEKLGTYSASKVTIDIGAQHVELVPVGTLLIGSAGRVDMKGPRRTVRIVLADRDSDAPRVAFRVFDPSKPQTAPAERKVNWTWKLVSEQPQIRYLPLTEEGFKAALLDVADA